MKTNNEIVLKDEMSSNWEGKRGWKTIERFLKKFVKGNKEDCWEWQGAKTSGGYGSFMDGLKTRPAHVVSFEVFRGEIGKNNVLHICDNKLCVNPFHLRLGNQSDNMCQYFFKNPRPINHPRAKNGRFYRL